MATTTTTTTTSGAPVAGSDVEQPSPIVETGGFEEDDEFEEFEEDGEFVAEPPTWLVSSYDDWTNMIADIALTNGLDWPVADEAAREDEWDEDWDDDLVEGDFVTQLRQELQATANQGK